MAFNTGNPLGSTDPRDFSDNSENLDRAVNNAASATWTDRFGNSRTTLAGQIGYRGTGTDGAIESYSAGLVLESFSTIILYNNEFYRPSSSSTLPYTTTATTPDVDSNLVAVGDAVLRQDLANSEAGLGSELVARSVIQKKSIAEVEALTGTINNIVYLDSSRRSGHFYWDASDLSTEVSADAQQGIYIAPSSDATGASGAWVRRYSGPVKGAWFGADDTSSTNTTALQAMWDFVAALGYGGAQVEYDYEIESPLDITKSNHAKYMNVVLSGPGNIKKATSFTGDRLVNIASDFFDEDNIVFFHVSFDGVNKSVNGVDWFNESEAYDSNPTTATNTVYSKAVRFDNCNFNNCYRGARVSGNSNTFASCTFRGNSCGTFNTAAANDIRYIGCSFRRGGVGAHIKTASASLGTVSTQFFGCVFESNEITGLALEGRPNDVGLHGFYFENNGFTLDPLEYPSMGVPAKACHIYSFGPSDGGGLTTLTSGEFWPSPAGVVHVYGSQISRFTFVNTPATVESTNIFDDVNAIGTFDLASINVSAATMSQSEIILTINGVGYYAIGTTLKELFPETLFQVAASATQTVATTATGRDMYEIWAENGAANAVKLIAHRGSSTVTEVALMGGATGKPTAAWSGDDLQVTAGSTALNRVVVKKVMII